MMYHCGTQELCPCLKQVFAPATALTPSYYGESATACCTNIFKTHLTHE